VPAERIDRPPARRADRFRGALVGVAVGDALGAPFEGRPRPVLIDEIDVHAGGAGPLRTTDDTAMTIAVAESLLFTNRLDEDHLARTFVTTYLRDPYRGYGAGVAALLGRLADGDDWRSAAPTQFAGQGSWGNGAAMRVAPIGISAAGDPDTAADLARRTARLTHTHPLGVAGAAVQAAAIAVLVDQPPDEIVDAPRLIATLCRIAAEDELGAALDAAGELAGGGTPGKIARTLGTGVAAVEAVPAALCAFLRHPDSFADAVRLAIGLGGDTDTIAAMTGALAGARLGHTAIPGEWARRTEHSARLQGIADRLARRH
jgi:poly(ADP-ribose) glycohydrolase ARH3